MPGGRPSPTLFQPRAVTAEPCLVHPSSPNNASSASSVMQLTFLSAFVFIAASTISTTYFPLGDTVPLRVYDMNATHGPRPPTPSDQANESLSTCDSLVYSEMKRVPISLSSLSTRGCHEATRRHIRRSGLAQQSHQSQCQNTLTSSASTTHKTKAAGMPTD